MSTFWFQKVDLFFAGPSFGSCSEVVNAVFVQQTLQVAKGDEEVLFLEKQKAPSWQVCIAPPSGANDLSRRPVFFFGGGGGGLGGFNPY